MDFNNLNLLFRYAEEYGHARIRVLGMSDTEHTICTFLFGHSGASQDDAAQALRLDKTTVARALATLEAKQYVLRNQNPENRRKNMLYLTGAGRAQISQVVDLYDHWLNTISSCLSPEEQQQFDDACARMLAEARRMCEEERG